MAYVDEKIALLEREARRQEKEAETENTPMEEQQDETRYLTLEEMLEAVREGSVTFPNQEKFEFGFSEVLSEKVPMPLVKDIFTDVEENDDAAIYVDDGYGISQIVTLTDKPITEGSIGDMKKQLEKGMQEMNSYAEVTKEKVLENLEYLGCLQPRGGYTISVSVSERLAAEWQGIITVLKKIKTLTGLCWRRWCYG